jgi:hypothetical protein
MRLSVGRWVRKRTFISASSTLDNVERERPQQGKKKIRPSPPTVFSLAARLYNTVVYIKRKKLIIGICHGHFSLSP